MQGDRLLLMSWTDLLSCKMRRLLRLVPSPYVFPSIRFVAFYLLLELALTSCIRNDGAN